MFGQNLKTLKVFGSSLSCCLTPSKLFFIKPHVQTATLNRKLSTDFKQNFAKVQALYKLSLSLSLSLSTNFVPKTIKKNNSVSAESTKFCCTKISQNKRKVQPAVVAQWVRTCVKFKQTFTRSPSIVKILNLLYHTFMYSLLILLSSIYPFT